MARQIRGADFFQLAMSQCAPLGTRHYFYGATPQTLEALEEAIGHTHPSANAVGYFSPSMTSDVGSLVEQLPADVGAATVDLLWIAFGTPKQDFVADALAQKTGLTVLAVGAAFDFAAGTVKEAPNLLRGSGFEWAYRLFQEPRRLWRRYLFGNLTFVRAILAHRKSVVQVPLQ
jgi:N-acetylglucosaminyldiphosphoundecaprenol N-acetyl-beta-D-mannosaminyltransferase